MQHASDEQPSASSPSETTPTPEKTPTPETTPTVDVTSAAESAGSAGAAPFAGELAADIETRFRVAFDGIEAGADPVVRRSQRAHFQANGALALAKKLGVPPREVAEKVLATVELTGLASAEVAGPGFINVTVDDLALAAAAVEAGGPAAGMALRPEAPARRVVVDYSAPNVAKEMHVGHLRTTIIGDALVRMHEFVGHTVVRENHIGDWGTPFGMLIEHLIDAGDAGAEELSLGELNSFYQAARQRFDGDEQFAARSRARVVSLQGGHPATLSQWRKLVELSNAYFTKVYQQLGVLLSADDLRGESAYNPMLDDVVADLDQAGLLVEDGGALVVFPPGFVGRDDRPLPLIVRKADGGFGYAATDLATVRDRVDRIGATDILYVVGSPQALHFEMVFAVCRMAGWLPDDVHVEHVAFGNVLGSDHKILRTRAGKSVKLVDLLDEAVASALAVVCEKNPSLLPSDADIVARAVGIGAVKYADLSTDRSTDYVFDIDRMVALDGNTGPYLQYAVARISSIFRRGEASLADHLGPAAGATIVFSDDAERELALQLAAFPTVFRDALDRSLPHRLASYLFDTASSFTTFYDRCPVLRSEGPTRASRLALCASTWNVLTVGLGLLGIEVLDRM